MILRSLALIAFGFLSYNGIAAPLAISTRLIELKPQLNRLSPGQLNAVEDVALKLDQIRTLSNLAAPEMPRLLRSCLDQMRSFENSVVERILSTPNELEATQLTSLLMEILRALIQDLDSLPITQNDPTLSRALTVEVNHLALNLIRRSGHLGAISNRDHRPPRIVLESIEFTSISALTSTIFGVYLSTIFALSAGEENQQYAGQSLELFLGIAGALWLIPAFEATAKALARFDYPSSRYELESRRAKSLVVAYAELIQQLSLRTRCQDLLLQSARTRIFY